MAERIYQTNDGREHRTARRNGLRPRRRATDAHRKASGVARRRADAPPGNPRRWLLITREKGIAESAGEGARWALDHLLVDQDARPTLAEVKRGWNSEIRRTIVGQVLEYAAHASETWTAKELRETFERSASERDTNPQEELDRLLQTGAPADADAFWEEVERNLDANRLRLLFISDRIPDELARVATFLNEQMPDIEVLAVEIKRFQGETNQTLVPRVIGRTTRGAKAARGRAGSRLTRESFLDGFADEGVRAVASDLLDVAQQGGARIAYGQSFGLSIRVPCEGIPQPISVAWLYTKKDAGWMRTREFTFGVVLYEHELPPRKARTRRGVPTRASRGGVHTRCVQQGRPGLGRRTRSCRRTPGVPHGPSGTHHLGIGFVEVPSRSGKQPYLPAVCSERGLAADRTEQRRIPSVSGLDPMHPPDERQANQGRPSRSISPGPKR